jgi:hypothetical protein
MPEIYELSRVDASNQDTSKGGWTEGMKRSDVNDRARENLGAIRRWYEDGEWTRLLEEQNDAVAYTISKTNDTEIACGSVPATDATAKFPVGTRCRLSISGSSAVEAQIATSVFNSPDTDVTFTFPPIYASETAASTSGTGTAGSPASFTIANTPIVAGSVKISDTAAHIEGQQLTDDGAGNLVYAGGNVGTINYATGACVVNLLAVAFDADVTVKYQYTEVVPAGVNQADIYFNHSHRDASHREVGMAGGKLVLYEEFASTAFVEQGPDGTLDADTLDGFEAQDLLDIAAGVRNYITNPSFRIAQRGNPIDASGTGYKNNNDSYVMDRWKLLCQVNDDYDIAQVSDGGPPSVDHSVTLTATVTNPGSPNSRKGGLFQTLPAEDSHPLGGQTVSFSFYAKTSGGDLNRLDAALLGWDGTADSPTSGLVAGGGWNAAGVEPTWATGAGDWIRIGGLASAETGFVQPTSSWRRYTIEGVAIPANTYNNLAVGIWVDDNDITTGDSLEIAGVQLEVASVASTYREPTVGEQLAACMRFFQKTFARDQKVGQNVGFVGALSAVADLFNESTAGEDGTQWRFAVPLWKDPVIGDVITYDPNSVAATWASGAGVTVKEPSAQSVNITGIVNTGDRVHAIIEVEL